MPLIAAQWIMCSGTPGVAFVVTGQTPVSGQPGERALDRWSGQTDTAARAPYPYIDPAAKIDRTRRPTHITNIFSVFEVMIGRLGLQ